MKEDYFELYDLEVTTLGKSESYVCSHEYGSIFEVQGENLIFKTGTKDDFRFSFYALSALIPLLAVKQRKTEINDWITSDELIACPDPNCTARFKITRKGFRKFSHSEVTIVPVKKLYKKAIK